MVTAAAERATAARFSPALPWLVALAGFLVMYAPSYWQASHGFWQSEEFSHGPLILAIALGLLWQRRKLIVAQASAPAYYAAAAMFGLATVTYVLGRALSIASIEFVSHWLMAGCVLLLIGGTGSLRAVRFAWGYLLFMVPLPATLVDAITGPMKAAISTVVVDGLHALGYPIARAGVMITIGQYQLLVADACSGLNSMFSLAALGTLFIYMVSAQRGTFHNLLLIAAIIPIAFAANVIRVVALVLVTYHLGDDMGQGFLHGFAGLLLMVVSLLVFMGLDRLLTAVLPATSAADAAATRSA